MKKLFLALILLSVTLASCSKVPTSYSDFDDLHLETWDEVDKHLTDGLFIVYYYSPHCPDCISIEVDFSKKIYNHNDQYTVYLMKSMDVSSQGTPPIDLRGVPALFIYEDKIFQEMILGPSNVMNFMNGL